MERNRYKRAYDESKDNSSENKQEPFHIYSTLQNHTDLDSS